MDYTRQLAQFAAQLQYSDLPPAVIEKAKEIALHAWGVQLAGSTLPWSKAVYWYVRDQGGVPQSTVVNYGLKTSAVNAAFANGTFGHGFEMDDNHAATSTKGGCVIVPAILAVGEQQLSTGKEFILAMVVAYEVMTRIALSVNPALSRRGHHPTGACGPFGAGTAVGKLLRFDERTMLHTMSIAAGHSAGIQEAPATGRGNLKRIFGGMAGSNGIRSALLARNGLTGPDSMLEGERGFCRAFGDDTANLAALTAGLGKEWQILGVHYKVYAQDGYIQPMTEALERLVKRHSFSPENIAEIRAGTNRHAHDHIIGVIREPKDLTSAQFSANFSLALFLVKGGAGFQEYTEENLVDPRIIDLSRKIRTEVDEEIEQEWQRTKPRGARVTVRLTSGETYTECVHMLRAMTAEDVNEKSRRLAAVAVGPEQCERLVTTARNLDAVRDVSSLVPLLTR
ncbi:MAG: MmgE/PrpD family protein [Betaproteobacteria bacterium]|nr:MmgE/PrpD family protein [Betaproteobacteria bacterium]